MKKIQKTTGLTWKEIKKIKDKKEIKLTNTKLHVKKKEEKNKTKKTKTKQKKESQKIDLASKKIIRVVNGIKNFRWGESLLILDLFPDEILIGPASLCDLLIKKGVAVSDGVKSGPVVIEVSQSGKDYTVREIYNQNIDSALEELFKDYILREYYSFSKDSPVYLEELSKFLRRYYQFYQVYSSYFNDGKPMPLHVFLSKCKERGVPPQYATTLLDILSTKGYISRKGAEYHIHLALPEMENVCLSG